MLRDVTLERAALIPYLYTQSRLAFETGVSWLRPMYYDWPNEALSY
jgi:alpha-glucosidase (family GH31 glycosyl hydrolase)